MKTLNLEPNEYYMNIMTGSVALGIEWESDYQDFLQDATEEEKQFNEWNELTHVEYRRGKWVEVEI